MKNHFAAFTASLLLLLGTAAYAQKTSTAKPPRYVATELNVSGNGASTVAAAINDRGEVAGNFSMPGRSEAFVRDAAASYKNLTTSTGVSTTARHINSWGFVVGDVIAADSPRRAFRWTSAEGAVTLPIGDNSSAYAINGVGTSVGEYWTKGRKRAFLWDRFGNAIDVAAPVESTWGGTTAYAINNFEQVAGAHDSSDGFSHAFIWTGAAGMKQFFPGAQNSAAYAINDRGQVAGTLQTAQGWKAFILDPATGGYLTFPALSPKAVSSANAINEAGTAVGQSASRAALYLNGKTYDLNALTSLPDGVLLTSATSINSAGQVVVTSSSQTGLTRSFMLTPLN